MAFSTVKCVTYNLTRVRTMASSAHFYSSRCFQFDKRDSEDVCILTSGSKPGSLVHRAVNASFDSRVSPIGNLFRLLNLADGIIGRKFLSKETPWNWVEDDKALYLLRTMAGQCEEPEASVPQLEYTFAVHHDDLKESVPHAKMNMSTVLSLSRGGDLEPSGYYYQVMHDLKELPRLAEPASETTYSATLSYNVSKKLQNPQAIRILIGLEGWDIDGRKTDDHFQGYAFEVFLPDNNIQEAKDGIHGDLWEIIIPKKKGGHIQTVGGNLLFIHEKNICKPTLWRPR